MSQPKIAIFPAAGALGTSVYKHILKLLPADQVVLITRNLHKIPKEIVAAGTEVRQADYNDSQTFDHVFDGIMYLFLISYPSIEIEHRFQAHTSAITAAIHSSPGIKHVFYTSLAFAHANSQKSAAQVMQAHLRTEEWLKQLATNSPKLTYTVIRQGIYSESYPMYTAFFDVQNPVSKIRIPHDGSGPGIAWVAIEDLGEADARIIQDYLKDTSDERYRNTILLLSGPRAWSLEETVQLLGECAGDSVAIEEVSFDRHAADPKVVEALSSHGPGEASRNWTTVFEAIRAGETGIITRDLEHYLGRPAEEFETTVRRMMSL